MTPTPEQHNAIARTLSTNRKLIVICGPAYTGKTSLSWAIANTRGDAKTKAIYLVTPFYQPVSVLEKFNTIVVDDISSSAQLDAFIRYVNKLPDNVRDSFIFITNILLPEMVKKEGISDFCILRLNDRVRSVKAF